MFKRIGILALMLSASGAVLLPKTAFAQDGYYAPRDHYSYSDRDDSRREAREWRNRRADEWREHMNRDREWREHEWREHEWRERDNWNGRYDRGYPPAVYFGFGYQR